MNTFESRTKTSFEQQWGIPSTHQQMKDKYAKGQTFEQLFSSRQKPQVEPMDCDLDELKKKSALRLCKLQERKGHSDHSMANFLAAASRGVQLAIDQLECAAYMDTFLMLVKDHPVYRCNHTLTSGLQLFYDKYVSLSDDEIIQVAIDTVEQAGCEDWFADRLFRVSASSNAHKIKTRTRKSADSLVYDFINARKFDTEATKYGRENEPVAKAEYERLHGVEVKKLGLAVHRSQNWLCASVDGVVIHFNEEGEFLIKLVEIKCPSSCQNTSIVDYDKNVSNVKYLELVDGVLGLKKVELYYTQCQVQMYVTGTTLCDLFVYSPKGSVTVTVYRDEQFLRNVIMQIEDFYYCHFLPGLQDYVLWIRNKRKMMDPKIFEVIEL